MSQESTPAESKPNGEQRQGQPDPAFRPRKRRKGKGGKARRRFTAAYKLRILQEIDALESRGNGEVGEILRREGLYTSHISTWRRLRDEGALSALSQKRGRKTEPDSAVRRENARLKAELERTKRRLAQAEAIVDIQKKVCEMLQVQPDASGEKS